ncbi:MAG: ABC transporter ATP-binding protein [Candidatus Omnitrophica bacterium]|nr:ABC transporter ATP-binding protein [Candidatus Omnitrophota bacterium]
MRYILEFNKVTKIFYPPFSFKNPLDFLSSQKAILALNNITFQLREGVILAVLGPNGAGKTTLLKIISTLILPDSGTVKIKDLILGKDDLRIKSLIGWVGSSERGFYPRLTGRQNLEFFACLYGLDKKKINLRLQELFKFFKIDYQDKRFDTYSSGMQQKFALMRALLHDPELLLLDEPLKSLDYTTALNLRNFIKEHLVKEKNKTVIFTTHRMEEAVDFADLFMILVKGYLYGLGTLSELRKKVNNPSATLSEIFLKLTQ